MCLNIYVKNSEKEKFKKFIKSSEIIAIKKVQTDSFLPEGTVYRIHTKEDFKNKRHNPENVLKNIHNSSEIGETVYHQIFLAKSSLDNIKHRNIFNKEIVEESEFIYNAITTWFAVIRHYELLSFVNPEDLINMRWTSDWAGCHLALTVFPGYSLSISHYNRETSATSMWLHFYDVMFSQPVTELEYIENHKVPEIIEDKRKYIGMLMNLLSEQILSKYYFVSWRCSDTGKHAYFIINVPKYRVILISNFPSPHYLPLDKEDLFDYKIDKQFANIVEKSPQSFEGCLNIISYILQSDDDRPNNVSDILQAWQNGNKYLQLSEIIRKM